jgi:SAM-dependent methyltransferase
VNSTIASSSVGDSYSALWFRTFLDSIDPAQTATEVAFLQRQLPLPAYAHVLDLCCGNGRHAMPLATGGYDVTGVDREPRVIAQAQANAPHGARFVQADVRTTAELDRSYDAVMIMWASFGYFSTDENAAVLARVRNALRPGGRLVLDVYNRDFFERHEGERRLTRAGVSVIERKQLHDNRLTVELRYAGHDAIDRFEWQLFRPAELRSFVRAAGFEPVVHCARFEEGAPITAEEPRMQLVAERR